MNFQSDDSKLLTFDQGDTVTVKLEPIKVRSIYIWQFYLSP